MRLSEVFANYESDKMLEGYSPHTLKAYTVQARLLIRGIGDIDIEEVTVFTLKNYLSQDAKRLKPSSIGHRVRFIKSFFRWSLDEGLINHNPASKLKEPKVGSRVPKALTELNIELLRESCKTAYERALFELFFTTGCRIAEIHKINRRDIDWETRSIIVRGKGDKEREVYFSIKADIWLKRYLNGRSDSDPALFIGERRPICRVSVWQIRHVVKRIAKRSGIDDNVYPHKLRHSYATHLLNNGAPLEIIQSLLGHSKLETTRLYAQLSGERRRELYRKYF